MNRALKRRVLTKQRDFGMTFVAFFQSSRKLALSFVGGDTGTSYRPIAIICQIPRASPNIKGYYTYTK